MPADHSDVFEIDGIEAFRRLPISLVLFGTQSSGPGADWVSGDELEALASAHPHLKLRLLFEYSDEQRIAGHQDRCGFEGCCWPSTRGLGTGGRKRGKQKCGKQKRYRGHDRKRSGHAPRDAYMLNKRNPGWLMGARGTSLTRSWGRAFEASKARGFREALL